MDDSSLDDLRAELASLETAEAKISAERRNLHNQIDYGFATDATRAREREVSDERRQLHQRIDALRELLRERDPQASDESEPPLSPLSQWSGISPEVVANADALADEVEP
jgi:DNA repair exonuclease SbcCD ATPase subunit